MFWYKDLEDNTIRKGDTGTVKPGLTIQQKYQMQLLSRAAQTRAQAGSLDVTDTEPARKDRSSTLYPKDLKFHFKKGDRVHLNNQWNKCRVGKVESCYKTKQRPNRDTNMVCKVTISNKLETLPMDNLTPADADWPLHQLHQLLSELNSGSSTGGGKGKGRRLR